MADNIRIETGEEVRTNEIGGIHYPSTKLVIGIDGTDSGFVSSANPLPVTGTLTVTGALTDAQLRATPVPVSGTIAFSNTTIAVTNAGTFAVQATQSGAWSVTANAGTNLNTSALSLETTQLSIKTAIELIDNIVESDRAKVNPIVGQLGIQGNSGVVTALTQRVVLATDIALPSGSNAIGKLAANDGIDIGDVTINNPTLAVTQSGTWNITNISGTVSLPTGASTAANQATEITSLQLIDDTVYAEDTASANLDKGLLILAKRSDTVAATSGTDGDYEPLQVGLGRLYSRSTIEATPTVVGLDTIFSNAATATVAVIKASAGNLYALEVSNPNANDVFLQIFDLATGSVTLGTTVPKQSFLVPAAVSSTIRGACDRVWTIPITFTTAISYAVTTTPTGNTAPGSNCTVNAEYK